MILYHGTDFETFEDIKKDGCIKLTTEETTHYAKDGHYSSNYNYLYLTSNPLVALDFGNRRFSNKNVSNGERKIVVISIDVEEENVEIDEVETASQTSTIKNAKYFKCRCNIPYDKFNMIAYFEFDSFGDCCYYYDDGNVEKIIWSFEDEVKWNKQLRR